MASDSRVRSRKRIYCPHCEDGVSHATYYRHRERFYDRQNGQWTSNRHAAVSAAATTNEYDNSSSCGEIDDLSTPRSTSPVEGLQNDSSEPCFFYFFGPGLAM